MNKVIIGLIFILFIACSDDNSDVKSDFNTTVDPLMEKQMRIGDYLFVNKLRHGDSLPMTPISIPFEHNKIPDSINRKDILVFPSDTTELQ